MICAYEFGLAVYEARALLYMGGFSKQEIYNICEKDQTGEQRVSFNNNLSSSALVESNKLMIFPNPAKTNLTLQLGDNEGKLSVKVKNTLGQVITSLEAKNTNSLNIDLSEIPSGVYFLSVSGETINKTLSFIKQ